MSIQGGIKQSQKLSKRSKVSIKSNISHKNTSNSHPFQMARESKFWISAKRVNEQVQSPTMTTLMEKLRATSNISELQ